MSMRYGSFAWMSTSSAYGLRLSAGDHDEVHADGQLDLLAGLLLLHRRS